MYHAADASIAFLYNHCRGDSPFTSQPGTKFYIFTTQFGETLLLFPVIFFCFQNNIRFLRRFLNPFQEAGITDAQCNWDVNSGVFYSYAAGT